MKFPNKTLSEKEKENKFWETAAFPQLVFPLDSRKKESAIELVSNLI